MVDGMTQALEPLDLDAVQERYNAAFETTWTAQVGETEAEFGQRTSEEQNYAYWNCAKDVPDLVAEIQRLRLLLNEAHADADELLYPGSSNSDPDWYIAQQAADGAFHRMGEQP